MENTNSYITHKYQDGKYIVTRVREESTSFSVEQLTGTGTVTHFGGNGRIRFTMEDNRVFESEFCPNIAKEYVGGSNTCKVFHATIADYSQVVLTLPSGEPLDKGCTQFNKYYVMNNKEGYWKEITD